MSASLLSIFIYNFYSLPPPPCLCVWQSVNSGGACGGWGMTFMSYFSPFARLPGMDLRSLGPDHKYLCLLNPLIGIIALVTHTTVLSVLWARCYSSAFADGKVLAQGNEKTFIQESQLLAERKTAPDVNTSVHVELHDLLLSSTFCSPQILLILFFSTWTISLLGLHEKKMVMYKIENTIDMFNEKY